MLAKVDRIFGWLLVLASCLHAAGTVMWTPFMSGLFVWSLGASLAAAVLGALNLVRAGRPHDTTVAAIAAAGTAGWVLVALGFGKSIGNLWDPRVVSNVVIGMVLVAFSIMTLRRSPITKRGAH